MQDLLAFLVVMLFAVGGAELVRATCRRQLAAPVPVRVATRTSAGVISD